jgi:hypothetical protein
MAAHQEPTDASAALAAGREGDIQDYRELQATALERARALQLIG